MEIAMARRVLLPARILNLIPIVDAWMPAARPKRMAKKQVYTVLENECGLRDFWHLFPQRPRFRVQECPDADGYGTVIDDR